MSDVLFEEAPTSTAPIPIDDPSAALHFCRTLAQLLSPDRLACARTGSPDRLGCDPGVRRRGQLARVARAAGEGADRYRAAV